MYCRNSDPHNELRKEFRNSDPHKKLKIEFRNSYPHEERRKKNHSEILIPIKTSGGISVFRIPQQNAKNEIRISAFPKETKSGLRMMISQRPNI